MKTLICWFPVFREDGGLRFIPPHWPQRRLCALGLVAGAGGKGREHASVGHSQREGFGGSAPAAVSADSGVPISGRFRDSEMSWAVCPKRQHHLCVARLLGRGSIDPSAQKQLEHIWLPDGVTPASREASGHWELTPALSWSWGLCHGASLCRQPSCLCSGGFPPWSCRRTRGLRYTGVPPVIRAHSVDPGTSLWFASASVPQFLQP